MVQKYVVHQRKKTHHGEVISTNLKHMNCAQRKELYEKTKHTLRNLETIDKHFAERVDQGVVVLDKELARDAIMGKFKVVEKVEISTPIYKDGELTGENFVDTRVLIQMNDEREMEYERKHAAYRIRNNVYYVISLTRKSLVTGYASEINKLKKSEKGVLYNYKN